MLTNENIKRKKAFKHYRNCKLMSNSLSVVFAGVLR